MLVAEEMGNLVGQIDRDVWALHDEPHRMYSASEVAAKLLTIRELLANMREDAERMEQQPVPSVWRGRDSSTYLRLVHSREVAGHAS